MYMYMYKALYASLKLYTLMTLAPCITFPLIYTIWLDQAPPPPPP